MSELLSVSRGCLVLVLGSLACGPSTPETGADTRSSTDDAGTSAATSGTDTQATTGSPPDPTSTTSTTSAPGETDSTSEPPDPTTDEPPDCPKGQAPFEPRWATVLEQPELAVWGTGGMTATPDGGVAVSLSFQTEDKQRGYGVMLLAKDGELLGTHLGPLSSGSIRELGLAVDADQLVLFGGRLVDGTMKPFLTRFAGDGPFVAEVALGEPALGWEGKLTMLDTPVLLGQLGDGTVIGTKLAPGDVGSTWSKVINAGPAAIPLAAATDAGGRVLFVSGPDSPGKGVFQLQMVDSAGATVWSWTIDDPLFGVARDAVAIPGGWAVLHTGGQDEPVRLLALAGADGATQWDVDVALANEDGPPQASRVHLIGDRLTIPVLRTLDFQNLEGPHTAAAHRFALDGTSVDESPLSEATLPKSQWSLESTVNACGELVTLSTGVNGSSRVGSYVP